jgi:hypothetical protein
MTRAEQLERHRKAQARYAATDKGGAAIKRKADAYVSSGRKAEVQARWARARAGARDAELEAELGLTFGDGDKLRAILRG